MKKMNFKEFMEYDEVLNTTACLMLEHEIDPHALQELADIYLEFNPLPTLGGIAGAALGGVPGAMLGSGLGAKVGQKIGGWFNKGRATQIGPAFQQAKQAVANLVQAVSSSGQDSPEVQDLIQTGQQIQQALQGVEKQAATTDQNLKTAHDQSAREQGGIAQKLQGAQGQGLLGRASRWLGQKAGNIDMFNKAGGVREKMLGASDKMSDWSKRHPTLSKALTTGGTIGAGYMLGKALSGGGHQGGMDQGGSHQGGMNQGGNDPNAIQSSSWWADDDTLNQFGGKKNIEDMLGGIKQWHNNAVTAASENGLDKAFAQQMSDDQLSHWLNRHGVDIGNPPSRAQAFYTNQN